MKRLTFIAVVVGIIILFVAATTQDKKSTGMDHQRHMQMMEMIKDSSMMDMVMANVAADKQMRMRMMKKMMEYTEGDSTSTMELCKVMMGKSEMKAMEGCGMMKQGMMMEKKSPEGKKETQDHKAHH